MTDASLIAADASLNSLIHNDPEEAERETVAQHRTPAAKPTVAPSVKPAS